MHYSFLSVFVLVWCLFLFRSCIQFVVICVCGVGVIRKLLRSLISLFKSGKKFGLWCFLLPLGMCLLSALLIMSLKWDVVLCSVCGDVMCARLSSWK